MQYGKPLCPICNGTIRSIENVPGPDGDPVHFYCFPVARARAILPGTEAGHADDDDRSRRARSRYSRASR
jgi:hypothetical protein